MIYRGLWALSVLLLLHLVAGQQQQPNVDQNEVKSKGRYMHELYGGDRGKYVPDDSGKYHHVPNPYDGGYGDRGEKYIHRVPPTPKRPPRPVQLGPHDHLRFMIDFNYNGSGFQVIEFEWVRDGDEDRNYNYLNKNKLWADKHGRMQFDGRRVTITTPATVEVETTVVDAVAVTEVTNVHVAGDFAENVFSNVEFKEETLPAQPQHDPQEVRDVINEVLEYVQKNILPTLS